MASRNIASENVDSGDLSELSRSPTPASTRSAETDPDDDAVLQDQTPKTVFEMVTSELLKIGAIPLERFATEDFPEEENTIPVQTSHIQTGESLIQTGGGEGNAKARRKEHFQAVAKIYEAAMRTFESSESISFDYKDDSGPNARECILTVKRPDGQSRSYASGPFFSNKSDAKAHVASVAVNMNVINFIKYGDVNAKSRSNAIVDSLDAAPRLKVDDGKGLSFADRTEEVVDDANVRSISECCLKWRAGLVKPVYVHFSEPTIVPRLGGKRSHAPVAPTEDELKMLKQGCALKVEISQHTIRVFSVHHIYKTRAEAKAAVAAVAVKQGVIDFIKYSNGQTAPMVFVRELEGDADENLNREVINETNQAEKEVTIEATAVNFTLKKHQIPLDSMTLQAFTNSLPKPFPETPGLKPTGEGNPVGWLNAAVQSARGSRMTITWTYLSNAKISLHGCLVRFNLPQVDEGRSYMVEPMFAKRSDAKSAVSLLAISQNVGGWIYDISAAVENLITAEMRTKAGSLMAPLNQECTRARIVGQPTYSYIHEEGAVGCTLRVEFSPDLWREYTVPVQYRTKPDARLAAILQAHHAGVIEFVRFKGGDPPSDYQPEQPYDWKMARKIEEAQTRGHDLSLAKEHTENATESSSAGMAHPDIEARGDNGWPKGGQRSQWQRQQDWNNNSSGIGNNRDQGRSSFSRGSYSRGRHPEGVRGFRGKNPSQRQGQPMRRYSGSEMQPRPAGARSPRADVIGRDDYSSSGFGARDSDRGYFRNERSHAAKSRSGDFSYAGGSGSGYRGPEYVAPSGSGPYADSHYGHPPPPHPNEYHGFPPPDPLPYPPSLHLDPYAPRSGFYPPFQPPMPHEHGPHDWRSADNHYPYPPPTSGYYDDYGYDNRLPPPGQSWRDSQDHRERSRFETPDAPRGRFESRQTDRLSERSPNRTGAYSGPTQRYSGSDRGGRGRGPSHGGNSERIPNAGGSHSIQPAENVRNHTLYAGQHSSNQAASARVDSRELGQRKSSFSPQKDPGDSSKGGAERQQQLNRKRPRSVSPSGGPNNSRTSSSNEARTIGLAGAAYSKPGHHETALAEHCTRNQMKSPTFKHDTRPGGKYVVSVTVDRERFSLPTEFDSVMAGREEVAKQVLKRLLGSKRKREGDV